MAQELLGAPFQLGMIRDGNFKAADNVPQQYGSSWYFSRKEIENFSPSRKDGIDSRKESELRICYCSFLKDFGMRLGVPQVTIATAIMFCHRFYLHQSHAKNDWQTVSTVCMFLASKVEDTPLSLDKVVIAAYETIYKKDPATARRVHQKDVFEKQKALILIGERQLLSTIRFDFNIQHPYRPLLHAVKKFGITQKDVRQVAWNFVNDSLRSTLCLQYKPHYIAAGSLFLAAKLHNVKLPSERGYVWWHEFDVTPQQLHVAIQEMMELLGYKRRPVVTCALENPTQTPMVAKEEASSSPDSCVLSTPGSSRSSSSQCSDEAAVRQRPADFTVPNVTNNSNLDGEHACGTGRTELQSQARDSESPDSIVEDPQVSGGGVDQARTKPKQVADIEECQGSGKGVDQTRAKPEPIADIVSCQGSREGVDQARTTLEQVADIEDCQGSGEGVDQMSTKCEQIADIVSYQGSDEGADQARTTPEQVTNIEGCQGSGEGVDQAPSYVELVIVVDLPRTNPEQLATTEDCQGSGESVDQARTKPEQVADGLSKIDMDRIKAMMKRRKREREINKRTEATDDSSEDAWIERESTDSRVANIEGYQGSGEGVNQAHSYVEQVIVVDLPRTNPELVATIADCQGSGEGVDQARTEPEQVADRLSKIDMDRIKAMRRRRKRERETNKGTEARDDSREDAWIERELETGIELTAKSAEKKQRLA